MREKAFPALSPGSFLESPLSGLVIGKPVAIPGVPTPLVNKEINMKKIIIGAVVLILIAVGIGAIFGAPARAAEGDEPCVPADAWTETIEHPAVTHVVHHDEVSHTVHIIDVEATPEVWANFSPNREQGPFEGPPSFPTDERGTWQMHDKIPGGHEGDDGVYQRDNPGSGRADWFYRHNATAEISHDEVVVDQEAYDETVVDEEAWTETIEHPAVVCEDDPEQPEPLFEQTITHDYNCGDNFQTTTIITVITPYVWDDELQEWVLGRPIHPRPLIKQEPHKVVACPTTPEEPNEPNEPNTPVKFRTPQPAVPLVIDAGL